MTQAVSQILSNAAVTLNRNVPSIFVGGNKTALQLLTALNYKGRELINEHDWAQLIKVHTVTLVADQQTYALPADYDRIVSNTAWNTNNNWTVRESTSPNTWNFLENSTTQGALKDYMRFYGVKNNQIYLHSTPSSSDAGDTITFEYITNSWIRPQTWMAGLTVSQGDACWYNGNRYTAGAAGTTGATPPTHTSGSVSDGVIDWAYVANYGYTSIVADSDVPHLDADLLFLATVIFAGDNFDTTMYQQNYARRLQKIKPNLNGAGSISIGGRLRYRDNIPDSNFGRS